MFLKFANSLNSIRGVLAQLIQDGASVALFDFPNHSNVSNRLATGDNVEFLISVTEKMPDLNCILTIYDNFGLSIANFNSRQLGQEDEKKSTNTAEIKLIIKNLLLRPGNYRINVAVTSHGVMQDHIEGAANFFVDQGFLDGRSVFSNDFGSTYLPHKWILPLG